MTPPSLARRFDTSSLNVGRITDFVVLITCAALISIIAWRYLASRGPSGAQADVLQPGSSFAVTGAPGNYRTAVVLVLHSQCRFCTDSMPFYRTLKERANMPGSRFRLQVVGIEPPRVLSEYLSRHALDSVPVTSQLTLGGIRATPSLVVVDTHGRVVRSWSGQLNRSQTDTLWSLLE
jgi:hypothetical protein